jgi:hypothetical protein
MLLGGCRPAVAIDYFMAAPDSGAQGTPTNNSPGNPIAWTNSVLDTILINNPGQGTNLETVSLILTPGWDPNIWRIPRYSLPAATPSSRVLQIRSYEAENLVTLAYVYPTNDPSGALAAMFQAGGWESWMLDFSTLADPGLAGFEIKNVILDGNWTEWSQHPGPQSIITTATPVWTEGFKLGALHVKGRTGLVENVKVRNCGANGITPNPNWILQGVEAFPLWVEASEFVTTGTVWTIQDCEVSDFHTTHGGYCTAIMLNTLNSPDAHLYSNARVGAVRRCQVRGCGAEIGIGSALSAGVVFSDNAIVGTATGLNHDTGSQRNMDITNNFFLDVAMFANVGGAGYTASGFTNYTACWNNIRLSHVPLQQNYSDYAWRTIVIGTFTNLMPVSDPTLVIGRFATGWCAGLRVGGVDRVRFETNRFTTRHLTNFFEPDPTNTALARWYPLYRPTNDTETFRFTDQSGTVSSNNLLSAVAFDFAGFTPTSAMTNIPACRTNPPAFAPGGRTGRVGMVFTDSGQLSGVHEISMTEPVRTNVQGVLQVEVKARLLFHPSALGAALGGNDETQVLDPTAVELHIRGANDGASATDCVDPATMIKTFRYQPLAENGLDELVGYLPAEQGGWLDENACVWSSAEIRLGTTVRFERTPDVADDRRLTFGTIRISRSGLLTNLDIKLEGPAPGYAPRPANPNDAGADFELQSSWGTAVPRDFNGKWVVTIPAGAREITLRVQPKAGTDNTIECEAAYLVLVGEPHFAIARPAPGTTWWTNPNYVCGAAVVTLWDGPKYRAYGLTDSYPCLGGGWQNSASQAEGEAALAEESEVAGPPLTRTAIDPAELDPEAGLLDSGQAIVNDSPEVMDSLNDLGFYYTTAYAINSLEWPAIAGCALYYNASCSGLPAPYFTLGGCWSVPNYDTLLEIRTPWDSPTIYCVDDSLNTVGSYNGKPCFVAAGTTTVTGLPSVVGANLDGWAMWLPASGLKPVGWSNRQTNAVLCARPTRWEQAGANWQAVDIGSFDGNRESPGFAFMNNTNGVTVGKTRHVVNGTNAWCGFRTIPSVNSNRLTADWACHLLPLNQTNGLINSVGNGVDDIGDAVGGSDDWYLRTGVYTVNSRAVLWWNGVTNAFRLPIMEPRAIEAAKQPGRSEAYAVLHGPGTLTVVGTSWATPTGSARAFVAEVADSRGESSGSTDWTLASTRVLNLNDPHVTVVPAGLVLTTSEAINERGWIVGLASSYGVNLGYVLIPQSVASQ